MPLSKPYPPTTIAYTDWDTLADHYAGRPCRAIVDADGYGDYTTIQAAIDALTALGATNMGEILVHKGTYIEDPRIENLQDLTIIGEGKGTILKTPDKVQSNITIDAPAAQKDVTVASSVGLTAGDIVCVRDDTHFMVNRIASKVGNVLTMVDVLAHTYEVADNGRVYTCPSTVYVTGTSKRIRITNLLIDGNRANQTFGRAGYYPLEHQGDGVRISATAEACLVDHCWVKSAVAHGICVGGTGNRAVSNEAWDCGYDGINFEPSCDEILGALNYSHDQDVAGWNGIQFGYNVYASGTGLLIGNICEQNRQGIAAQGGHGVQIIGNLLKYNREDGIEIYSMDRFVVTGNTIVGADDLSDMTNAGIHIEAASSIGVVTGNLIELCAGIGLYNEEGAYVSITGNTIRKVLKHGIKVASNITANGRDSSIVGNVIVGADFADTSTYDGIVICGDRCTVVGNRLDDCDRYGIHTDPTADKTLIVGNQVTQYVGVCVDEIKDEGTNTVLGRSRESRTYHSNTTIGAGGTVYLGPFGQSATEAEVSVPVPFACTAKNLFAKSGVAPGAGETYTYTLMVNGAPSALTCQTVNALTTSEDLTNNISLVPGDLVSVRVATSGASAVTRHSSTIELMIEETNIVV
jgi:parallel beta-helix repeat protein/putative cofactor-binding repeat protein